MAKLKVFKGNFSKKNKERANTQPCESFWGKCPLKPFFMPGGQMSEMAFLYTLVYTDQISYSKKRLDNQMIFK